MQGIWGKLSTEQKVIIAVLGAVAIIAIFLAITNSSRQKAALEAAQQQQQNAAPVAQQPQVEFFNIGGFQNEALGVVLLGDKDGKTLYTFANDGQGVSNCNDACTTTWPPYVFADP